jgi:hypothetical protein
MDYVVLCAPHTPSTEGMFDKGAFAAMKPGVVLVNIGRGQLVDEVALIEARRTGQVAFAALDITTIEPLPVGSPLWDHPNVLTQGWSAHKRSKPCQALPPSTDRTCPLTQLDRSDAKNRTAQAMSAGAPRRRVKIPSTRRFWPSAP